MSCWPSIINISLDQYVIGSVWYGGQKTSNLELGPRRRRAIVFKDNTD